MADPDDAQPAVDGPSTEVGPVENPTAASACGLVCTYWVGGLSRLTLCKVVSRGRAHGDSAYKLVRASSWKSSRPGKHMGIPN